MIARLPLLAALTYGLAHLTSVAHAACECGYLDPATNALWTDATITYFNETGFDDVVTRPAQSPGIYGQQASGSTGEGQESWVIVGDHVNNWEDSFGATYRSAVSYNNTFIDDQSKGISMQVTPANLRQRIVNGSQIVTRRRDILYGSFRASIQHAALNGQGAGFKFGATYNTSESIDTSIYVSDDSNASVWWSYSATSQDSMPRKLNYSWLDINASQPIEHRMDWLSDKRVQYRNNGLNESVAFAEYTKHVNATNLPGMPVPISLQTWSNGEPSGSQGPPTMSPAVTHVLYIRFFYNSTLTQRKNQFEEQCKTANVDICSTENLDLRNSTAFSLAATECFESFNLPFQAPRYAIYAESGILAIALMVIIHGYFVRKRQNAEKKKSMQTAKEQQASKEVDEEDKDSKIDYETKYTTDHLSYVDKMLFNASPNATTSPFPDLTQVWDSDSEYDSDDFDEIEPVTGSIEGRTIKFQTSPQLPTYQFATSNAIASPQPTYKPAQSHRNDSSVLGLYILDVNLSTSSFNPFASKTSSGQSQSSKSSEEDQSSNSSGESLVRRKSRRSVAPVDTRLRPLQLQTERTIISWGKRNGGDDVGQLARPKLSIAASNRRQSVICVRDTLVQSVFNKLRNIIFISGPVATTSIGERRIDYLDGMRGFACLFVSVGHFILMFYPGIANPGAPRHYMGMEKWVRLLFGPIIIDATLILGIFFMLPARTVCQRYLLKGGLLSMADSSIRRIPRIMLPVAGACLANYMMIDVGAYKWIPRLASRSWSTWAYYQNFDNVLTFLNSFISLWWATPPASPALVTGYATGVLWTIPLMVQGMWTCMLTTLVAHELKTAWKRFTFYAMCISLSWYANTWDMFFMGGLVIADLDSNLRYRERAARGISLPFAPKYRIQGVWFAWIFMLAAGSIQWLAALPGKAGNLALEEFGIHPDWVADVPHNWNNTDLFSYQDPQVFPWIWIMSIFILADLSNFFQTCFRLRIWSFLGKHAMAFFLCHGIIFWTWGAWLSLTLLAANTPYWLAILITFITSYIWLTLLCICFTHTFEAWAIMFSKACWRAASGRVYKV